MMVAKYVDVFTDLLSRIQRILIDLLHICVYGKSRTREMLLVL